MRCPYCDNGPATEVETWEIDGSVRRLRECGACGRRFSTRERPEAAGLVVVKRDGRREDYSRSKLARTVELACAKRPVSSRAVESLVERVEARLFGEGEAEVVSAHVGEVVLAELQELDEVAYLRFASYVRSFATAGAFVEAAIALQESRRRSAEARLQLAFDFDADQPHWN